jgi:hypothetical protein
MNYKMNWIKALGIATLSLIVFFVAWHWHVYSEVQALKAPRFEQGVHKGALFCAQCHRKIYDEWSTRSLHAWATAGESFNDYLAKFKASYILNTFITDAACYSCHGEKTSTEGVNCEICHGTVIANVPIMETHKLKYKPGLRTLQGEEFCIKCHEMRSPLSLDGILTVSEEWRNSQAATKGQTCQSCHMKKGINGLSYHGFDTAHRDATIYKADVTIQNAKLTFPRFSLEIENLITGHAIPPSGPTRVMVMEIIFLDINGKEQYRAEKAFSKKFELMPIAGIFPNRLIKNTQLQGSERQLLNFTLPASLEGKVNKAVATLTFYGVSDEHQGDIEHAHWISKPILTEEFAL